jgi:hypothetical protein
MTSSDLHSPVIDTDDTYAPSHEATEHITAEDQPTVVVPDSGPTNFVPIVLEGRKDDRVGQDTRPVDAC